MRRAASATAALTGLAAVVAAPVPAQAEPAHRQTALVAMGDSVMAGEGAGQYEPGSDQPGRWCHRSAVAQVRQARLPGVDRVVNLACSAAVTSDLRLGGTRRYGEPPQAEQLRAAAREYDVRTIVLTVGGNEISFVAMVAACVAAYLRVTGPCSGTWEALLPRRLAAIRPHVVQALGDIRAVMRAAGYADGSYDLVVESYPAPGGRAVRYPDPKRPQHGCPFRDEDVPWFHDVAFPALARTLREAADEVPGTRYLGTTSALAGHEVCAPGIEPGQEWFRGLFVDVAGIRNGPGPNLVAPSLHPNAAGQARLARCLEQFERLGPRTAECVRGPDGRPRLRAG